MNIINGGILFDSPETEKAFKDYAVKKSHTSIGISRTEPHPNKTNTVKYELVGNTTNKLIAGIWQITIELNYVMMFPILITKDTHTINSQHTFIVNLPEDTIIDNEDLQATECYIELLKKMFFEMFRFYRVSFPGLKIDNEVSLQVLQKTASILLSQGKLSSWDVSI